MASGRLEKPASSGSLLLYLVFANVMLAVFAGSLYALAQPLRLENPGMAAYKPPAFSVPVRFPTPEDMDAEGDRAAAVAKVQAEQEPPAVTARAEAQSPPKQQAARSAEPPARKVERVARAPRDERRDYRGHAADPRRDSWAYYGHAPQQRRAYPRYAPEPRRGWGFAGEPGPGGFRNWF